MKKLFVTGSSGLIGLGVCTYFSRLSRQIHGIDNNRRAVFFGSQGNNNWDQYGRQQDLPTFTYHKLDIRNLKAVLQAIAAIQPDAIVHIAAQPIHDRAAAIPFDNFDTNALGTLNLLEALRRYSTQVPFVHMSINKVYGNAPNEIPVLETDSRWDYADLAFQNGIAEKFRIYQTKHSFFWVSKVAANVMVQEYDRYFNIPAICLRGGCLTGPNHSGIELHGFLSYLIKCSLEEKKYTIFGYKGKQGRDNIQSFNVARFIEASLAIPRVVRSVQHWRRQTEYLLYA